jgi:hypothetical protein
MIISDLNHVEVVSEATRIEGGFTEFDLIVGQVYFTWGSFTKAATSTFTTPFSSSSGAFSVSVSN